MMPDHHAPVYGICRRCHHKIVECVCGKTTVIPPPPPETVEWRGERWLVADARFDDSGLAVGSHWHLTLTRLGAEQ